MYPDKLRNNIASFLESLKGLPVILRSPALLRVWLFKFDRRRLVLSIALLILFFTASPISQALVNYWHPPVEESFFTKLFNGDKIRKSRETREEKYVQYLSVIIGLGLLSTMIVLLSDLPYPVEETDNRSKKTKHSSLKSRPESKPVPVHNKNITQYKFDNENPDDSPTVSCANIISEPEMTGPEPGFIGLDRRYRLDSFISNEFQGFIEAVDTLSNRKVRLLAFPANTAEDKTRTERLKNEAQELALLNHPNLISVFDFFEHQGRLFLVMEWLTEKTLADRIEKEGAMPFDDCIQVIKAIASGLGFAHKLGFIHGAIKPANILFDSNNICRLSGFGMTNTETKPALSQPGQSYCWQDYMKADPATDKAQDTQSDMYSLGVTLYQMLTGQVLSPDRTHSKITQHEIQQAIKQLNVPASCVDELRLLIFTMLDSNTSNRFQSCMALIDALEQLHPEQQDPLLNQH